MAVGLQGTCAMLLALGAGNGLNASIGIPHAEFRRTYSLCPNGRIVIENLYGDVRITAWDRDEVLVEAIKRSPDAKRLTLRMPQDLWRRLSSEAAKQDMTATGLINHWLEEKLSQTVRASSLLEVASEEQASQAGAAARTAIGPADLGDYRGTGKPGTRGGPGHTADRSSGTARPLPLWNSEAVRRQTVFFVVLLRG